MRKRHSTFSTTINQRDLIPSSSYSPSSPIIGGGKIYSPSSPNSDGKRLKKAFRERPLIKFILKQRSKRNVETTGNELGILEACWRRIEEEEMMDYRDNLSNRLGFYFNDEEILTVFGNQLVCEESQQLLDNASTITEASSVVMENSLKSTDSARSISSLGSDSKLMTSPTSPNFDKKHFQSDSTIRTSSVISSSMSSTRLPTPNTEENKNLSYLYDIHDFPSKLDLIPTMHYNMLDIMDISSVQQIVNITSSSSGCSTTEVFKDLSHGSPITNVNIENTFSLEILDPSGLTTVDSFEDFLDPSFNPLNIRYLYCDFWANKREFNQQLTKYSLSSKKSNDNSCYVPFEELSKCKNCIELKLNNNKIRFLDSKYFSNFGHLKELNLSSNRMTKARLPEDLFSRMPLIRKLSLDYMGLKTLPKSINKLIELTHLSLSFNKLNTFNLLHGKERHLTEFWTKLICLEYLNLSGNRLNRFPSEICSCKSLEYLSLSNNRICNEIPKEIENLKKLTILFLNGNKFTALDFHRNLEFLENLTHLEIGHNPNIHVVPPPVYNLSKLESLCLNHLAITHLAEDIGKLRNLTHLDLYGSKITALPKTVAQLVNLKNLDMRYCRSISEFPVELFGQKISSSTITTTSPIKSLTRLSLSFTMIESVPEEISSLLSLQVLLMNDCPLLEEIKGIDKLVNLVEFDIGRCISLVEPPLDVCEKGLAHIRGYLKEKNDGPSVFIKFIGSVFGSNTKKKTSPINTQENSLKVEHNELLTASPVPSINSGDDSSDSDDELENVSNKKKSPQTNNNTVKSLFSFWK